MPQPTINEIHAVDPVLTSILVAYTQSQDRFIADRAFPPLSVPTKSGTYYKFTKKYWLTDEMQPRNYGGQYARVGYGVETDTYATVQYALAKEIADEERAANQTGLDLETAAVRLLTSKGLIRRERLWAAAYMKTSVWATDGSVGAGKWSAANSTPVADITTGKRTISQATGVYPNLLVMGEIVRDRLINHADMLDRIKYTQAAGVGTIEAALSAIFGINVVVGSAIYNSANEGATASLAPIIDDDILLLYTNPAPIMAEPSAGYSMYWEPGGGMGGIRPMVRLDANDGDLVKYKMQLTHELVASDIGYFMADVVD